MKRKDLVSVIIPVYNAANFIERCVKSITCQTYKNIEIILVNDGSKDDSYDVCSKLSCEDKRIILINQDNQGVVSARNNGFAVSHGDYIIFVDSDDWIESDMVEKLLIGIGDADIISSGVFWEKFPSKESYVRDEYDEGIYDTKGTINEFFCKMIYDFESHALHPLTSWIWNKMYKREIVDSVYNTLDESIGFAEDTTFVYKCFFVAKSFVVCHIPFYHYCYNENSVCHREQKNILSDISKVYVSLYEECLKRDKETALMKQLQMWIVLLIRVALNERLKFNLDVHIPQFLLDTRGLEKYSRLVLYGAGQVGLDYFHQLSRLGYDIPLWVDSNYQNLRMLGMDVNSPQDIGTVDFDAILIAIVDETAMLSIKNYLMEYGVDENKIVWKVPIWYQ